MNEHEARDEDEAATLAALRARVAELEIACGDLALAASERRYRDLVETSQDLIWSVDAEGRWTFLNHAATVRIYGREPAELLGHHFIELETPEQSRKDLAVFDRILSGQKYFEYETVHVHRDGTPIHLSFNAIVRHDAAGNVIGATGTAKDITERHRAEAEREEMRARLQQTQKLESLGVLAGGIAHDFNNLLVGILGNAGLALMEMPPGAAGRRAIEGVRDAAQRAADLARQMLAYSGRGRFTVERINLSEMVHELSALLARVLSRHAVLCIETADRLPPIDGDATQLRQVVMNLITNASDAVDEHGGTITVSTGVMGADDAYLAGTSLHDDLTPGAYVFVEVADTGCGMDAETKQRVFEPFFTTKFTGRGLGLAAVLGILKSHGGAIRVDSEPGGGTRMRVLLPPAEPATDWVATPSGAPATRDVTSPAAAPVTREPSVAAPVARASSAAAKVTGTVLVVDDEELVRDVSRSVLQHAGFSVLTARDGATALALFRERGHRIDAVVLDLTMPGLGAEETLRELQRLDPAVRVILTSGYSEQDVSDRFDGCGIAGFLRKPSPAEEMIACLREAIAR